MVVVQPEVDRSAPRPTRQQVEAQLKQLIAEAEALQRELEAAPAGALPAQAMKRARQLERLSKAVRKALPGF